MEDMARLGLLEQNVKDSEKFNGILCEILKLIHTILDDPHDYELRNVTNDVLKNVSKYEALKDYLKHIGFQQEGNELRYPKNQTLTNLKLAQAAIERKIFFCSGTFSNCDLVDNSVMKLPKPKKENLSPVRILKTNNEFLLKIQDLFNNMLTYEDEDLQKTAINCIPLVTLQLSAIDRMREQQRMLKAGEIKGQDMPFDTALLLELMEWFKYKFFSWVDTPECERCGAPTTFTAGSTMKTSEENCRVELYNCSACNKSAMFPRYNSPRELLRTRRGRCGEWANCFTLLCRALGYDTRYVYDTTDHVWCEIFDYDTNSWLHVDPCENKLNTPLMYAHGWNKQLSYVIAFSRDDLQDVTWRYTINHKEVLSRRTLCTESELISCMMQLRAARGEQLSEPRRQYLLKRDAQELVTMMVERKPTDYESQGRISGSTKWRLERGEITAGHEFNLAEPGHYCIRYFATLDKYTLNKDGQQISEVSSWNAGAFENRNMFRKVEKDWRMVYVARTEGSTSGLISWKISTKEGFCFKSLGIKVTTALYETGNIEWNIRFDDEPPLRCKLGDVTTLFEQQFSSVIISAELSGGLSDMSWQHAQLFRQPLDSDTSAFDITLELGKNSL